MIKSNVIFSFILLLLASSEAWVSSIKNLKSVAMCEFYGPVTWVKRPHKGPECVIEIVGVDLDMKANRRLDFFTKPDLMVECTHSRWERKTQIEGNTFNPRFAWKAKIPHKKTKGFTFTVYDCNVLEKNEVVGRVFLSPDEVEQMQSKIDDGSRILSLGHGIGQMKVRISPTPEDLEQTYTNSTEELN